MEEKKLDLNTVIGYILIFGILLYMLWQNQPTPEEIARRCQEIRSEWSDDEIARREETKVLPVWMPNQKRWAMLSQRFVYFPGRHSTGW